MHYSTALTSIVEKCTLYLMHYSPAVTSICDAL